MRPGGRLLLCFTILCLWPVTFLGGCGRGVTGDVPAPRPSADAIPLTTDSPEAGRLYREAIDLVDKQRLADAARLFGMALEHDPEFAMAHRGLALSLPSHSQRLEAVGQALELSDEVSDAERWMILASEAVLRDDRETELGYYEKLVAAYPGDARSHYLLAWCRYRRGELEEAVDGFERVLALEPEMISAYNLMGYSLRRLGRFERALSTFEDYIERMPEEPNPWDSYGELLMKMGRFEDSIASYEKALERNHRFDPSFVGIAHDLVFLDRGDEAREVLRQLHDLSEDETLRYRALLWTVATHLHEEDFESAVDMACELLALAEAEGNDEAMAQELHRLGSILTAAGDVEGARGRFAESRQLVEASDLSTGAKDRLRLVHQYFEARLLLLEGRSAEAMKLVEELREHTSEADLVGYSPIVHELLGRGYLAQGKTEQALEALAQMGEDHFLGLYLRGLARLERGELDLALELGHRVAHLNEVNWPWAFVRPRALALVAEAAARSGSEVEPLSPIASGSSPGVAQPSHH